MVNAGDERGVLIFGRLGLRALDGDAVEERMPAHTLERDEAWLAPSTYESSQDSQCRRIRDGQMQRAQQTAQAQHVAIAGSCGASMHRGAAYRSRPIGS